MKLTSKKLRALAGVLDALAESMDTSGGDLAKALILMRERKDRAAGVDRELREVVALADDPAARQLDAQRLAEVEREIARLERAIWRVTGGQN